MTALLSPSSSRQRVLGWLVSVIVPIALVLTSVRLMLTPLYVHIEYRTPGFPADPYGFSRSDRLRWSLISLDYLLNDSGIEFLENTTFEDGTPIYNARELRHMVDVKNVVQVANRVWFVALLVVLGAALWAWRGGWFSAFWLAAVRGGWITIGLVAATLIFVLVAFGVFFVFFHEIFFQPGTWTFLYSDTLIRLFPERFWRDTFLWVGLLSILQAWLVIFFGGRLRDDRSIR